MVNRWGHPTLYTLTSELIWPEAIERARTHPHEVKWQDPRGGGTALHHSCRFEYTLDVVREMLRFAQAAACIQDKSGYTPLHVACWNGASDDLITLLLTAHPRAASVRDNRGRTPLHLACASVTLPSVYVLAQLIQADPEAAFAVDDDGKTPLTVLCERHEGRLRDALQCLDQGANQEDVYESILSHFWDQLRLLLNVCASNRGTGQEDEDDDESWRLVHVLSSVPNCPRILFLLALKLHPHQVKQKVRGSLPLHLAAECRTWLNHETSSFSGYVTSLLISKFPKACQIPDALGRLPIHIAVETGKSWEHVIRRLFEAYPMGIMRRDGKHYLFPFHLAATTIPNEEYKPHYLQQQLTAMLEILLLEPSVIKPTE